MQTTGIKCPATGKVITSSQSGEVIMTHSRVSFVRILGENVIHCEGRVILKKERIYVIKGIYHWLGDQHPFEWPIKFYLQMEKVEEKIRCPKSGKVITDWQTKDPIKVGDHIKFDDYVSVVRVATCEGIVKEDEFLRPYVEGFYMEDGERITFNWKLMSYYSGMKKIG